MGFVRKVLGIVSAQLLFTFVIVIAASYSVDFGFFCTSVGCQVTSIIVYLFSLIALMCSRGLRHSVPMNYIVLLVFTASLAFMIAGITAWLTPVSVMISVGVLALVLTCMFGAYLIIPNKAQAAKGLIIAMIAALFIQFVLMISMLIAGYVQGMWILYCTLGIVICMGLIYFDLFVIMLAGKYAMDEYIYCAILLYVDIIRMLLYILMIFGKAK
jgi:protein lifeguard